MKDTLLLKRVEVGFSKFVEGSQYKNKGPVSYNGSFVLEIGSETWQKATETFANFLKEHGVSEKRIAAFHKEKFKKGEKDANGDWKHYVENQGTAEPEDAVFLWGRSQYPPKRTRFVKGDLIDSSNPDDLAMYKDMLDIRGGEIVNVEFKLNYWQSNDQVSLWPRQIHIIEPSPYQTQQSEEWLQALKEEKEANLKASKSEEEAPMSSASSSNMTETVKTEKHDW